MKSLSGKLFSHRLNSLLLNMTLMNSERYDRNIRFFGQEGQDRLNAAKVTIVGVGGLGTHVVQQLALLGVGSLVLIDSEELDRTNFNRYVGVFHDDPVPGTLKTDIGERLAKQINPLIQITNISQSLLTKEAFDAIVESDYVFGCVDWEGLRLILTELCAAYSKPYFDLASDVIQETLLKYGGRVCVAWDGNGCLFCYKEINIEEAQADLLNPEAVRDKQEIYGVPKENLDVAGPSVVSINGVVASLGVTEFMLSVTGLIKEPRRLLRYSAHSGGVNLIIDKPESDCYYCKNIWGIRDRANIYRYISEPR